MTAQHNTQPTMQDPEKLGFSQEHADFNSQNGQNGDEVEEATTQSIPVKKVVFRALLGVAALGLLSHQLAGHCGRHVSSSTGYDDTN
jgi:hypothetical protein